MDEIGVRELKSKLSETLRRVEAGQAVRVTSRGRTVAEIVPPRDPLENEIDPELLKMESEGRITLSRIPRSQRPGPEPTKGKPGKTGTELILEGRAERF